MSQQPPSRPRQATRRTTQGEDYTLAGPPVERQQTRNDPHNTYVEEGYRKMNPWMLEQELGQGSEISLANTFPHRVRFQRRPTQQSSQRTSRRWSNLSFPERSDGDTVPEEHLEARLDRSEPEKGEHEPAPQVETARKLGIDRHDYDRHQVDSEASTEVGDDHEQHSSGASTPIKRRIDAFRPNNQSLRAIADGTNTGSDEQTVNAWARFRKRFSRPLAEWLGTTILMFIGISGGLAVVTSKSEAGTVQTMYWTWGFAVMVAIYVAGGGSGAFLNPALTIMLSVFRGFPASRIPIYVLAQLLGAFTGALLAFAVYRDNIIHLDGALIPESTGIYFYTQPKDWVSPTTAFFTEFLGTGIIGCVILALGDSGNSPPGAGMHAFIIGLLVTMTTTALGYSTGGCFNGVRDLGPRLATLAVGYPPSLFLSWHWWWIWGPWGASITGALTGGLVYDLCLFKGGESPVNGKYSARCVSPA